MVQLLVAVRDVWEGNKGTCIWKSKIHNNINKVPFWVVLNPIQQLQVHVWLEPDGLDYRSMIFRTSINGRCTNEVSLKPISVSFDRNDLITCCLAMMVGVPPTLQMDS